MMTPESGIAQINSLQSRDRDGSPVRIALIGTGWIAEKVYLPCVMKHPGIEVAAAHDPSPEVLGRFAQAAGLTCESLALESCWAADVDAVILCTPPSVHAQQIARSVALNKFVLCEKPVFRNIIELEQLGRFSAVAARLMGSASMRLRKDVQLVLNWVTQGLIGPLEYVHLGWWRERGVPAAGSWRTNPRQCPMGVMEDLGPHLFDLLAGLISRNVWNELHVTSARLRCRYGHDPQRSASWFKTEASSPYAVPDQGYAALVSDTGTKIEVEVCWANDVPGDYCSLFFKGSNGTAAFKGLLGLSSLRQSPEQSCTLEVTGQPAEVHHFSIGPEIQIQAFADSIDIFAGFTQGICPPAANFSEIQQVTQWLTEIQTAAQEEISAPAPAVSEFFS
jgi:oxidoreductase